MPSGQAVFTHSSRFVQVQVFFEPDPEGPLGLHDVRVGRVVITSDVIYSSTFVLQGSLVPGVYNLEAQCAGRFVVHVDVMRLVDSSKLFGKTCYDPSAGIWVKSQTRVTKICRNR